MKIATALAGKPDAVPGRPGDRRQVPRENLRLPHGGKPHQVSGGAGRLRQRGCAHDAAAAAATVAGRARSRQEPARPVAGEEARNFPHFLPGVSSGRCLLLEKLRVFFDFILFVVLDIYILFLEFAVVFTAVEAVSIWCGRVVEC